MSKQARRPTDDYRRTNVRLSPAIDSSIIDTIGYKWRDVSLTGNTHNDGDYKWVEFEIDGDLGWAVERLLEFRNARTTLFDHIQKPNVILDMNRPKYLTEMRPPNFDFFEQSVIDALMAIECETLEWSDQSNSFPELDGIDLMTLGTYKAVHAYQSVIVTTLIFAKERTTDRHFCFVATKVKMGSDNHPHLSAGYEINADGFDAFKEQLRQNW